MSKPPPDGTEAPGLPRTVAEAVSLLVNTLSQAEKSEVAAMPEGELDDLHFGLGMRIRGDLGLWNRNRPLWADCQRIYWEGRKNAPAIPEGLVVLHPDSASGVIMKALWARLRH